MPANLHSVSLRATAILSRGRIHTGMRRIRPRPPAPTKSRSPKIAAPASSCTEDPEASARPHPSHLHHSQPTFPAARRSPSHADPQHGRAGPAGNSVHRRCRHCSSAASGRRQNTSWRRAAARASPKPLRASASPKQNRDGGWLLLRFLRFPAAKSLSPSSKETFQPNPGHMQGVSSWKRKRLARNRLFFFSPVFPLPRRRRIFLEKAQ